MKWTRLIKKKSLFFCREDFKCGIYRTIFLTGSRNPKKDQIKSRRRFHYLMFCYRGSSFIDRNAGQIPALGIPYLHSVPNPNFLLFPRNATHQPKAGPLKVLAHPYITRGLEQNEKCDKRGQAIEESFFRFSNRGKSRLVNSTKPGGGSKHRGPFYLQSVQEKIRSIQYDFQNSIEECFRFKIRRGTSARGPGGVIQAEVEFSYCILLTRNQYRDARASFEETLRCVSFQNGWSCDEIGSPIFML